MIYECRVCFNMFRSVANFIAHKRSYCAVKLKDVRHVYRYSKRSCTTFIYILDSVNHFNYAPPSE